MVWIRDGVADEGDAVSLSERVSWKLTAQVSVNFRLWFQSSGPCKFSRWTNDVGHVRVLRFYLSFSFFVNFCEGD